MSIFLDECCTKQLTVPPSSLLPPRTKQLLTGIQNTAFTLCHWWTVSAVCTITSSSIPKLTMATATKEEDSTPKLSVIQL